MYNPASMNKPPFDLVIFDCDGVLVESEELACRVYVDMLRDYGYSLEYKETLHKFYGMTLDTRLKISAQELDWTPPEDFKPIFFQRQRELSRTQLRAIPHIHELIESITLPICVASNGSREEVIFRLTTAGLIERFGSAIFSGAEMPRPKPAPDVYLAAAASFNIHPSRCIVIEDSVLGATAAIHAGMKVYGYVGFHSAEALQAAGATPFTSMRELKEIFDREYSLAQ